MNKQEILQAYNFRHACKAYDPTRKISEDDFNFLLETARLSPSSFGLEAWKMLVIENPAIRKEIGDIAWGTTGKATDASHLVAFLGRTQQGLSEDYQLSMWKNVHNMPDDVAAQWQGFFKAFTENDFNLVESPRAFADWSAKQAYIAMGNMMTAAAMIGIDSTPMEGFPQEKLNALLAEKGLFDPNEYQLAVFAAFGYRAEAPHRAKTRRAISDVVEFVK